MSGNSLITLAVAVIGATGGIGGIVAFRKLRPEKDSIVVSAAQGALLVQTGLMDEMRQELARAQTRIRECESALDERDVTVRTQAQRIEELELRLRVREGREHGPP